MPQTVDHIVTSDRIVTSRKSLQVLAGLALAAFAFCSTAHAAPLAVNGTIAASGEADPTGGTVVSNGGSALTSPFTAGSGPTLTTGSLISKVIQGDTSNPFGGLTFTFQLTNGASSAASLAHFNTSDFTGFQTDVSFQTPASGTAPSSVSRNGASVVDWFYSAVGSGQIPAGSSSALMVVQTDAKAFTPITANIQGATGATAGSFGPIPEPGSMALLATGALLFRRRRT